MSSAEQNRAKTVDVATKPGLMSGAKTALAALTVGAGVSATVAGLMPGRHVDGPSVVVAALLLGGAGYGLSRIGAGVSDSGVEHADGGPAGEETTRAAEATS